VRRKGKYVNETLLRRKDAAGWPLEVERIVDDDDVALFERLGELGWSLGASMTEVAASLLRLAINLDDRARRARP
jgi:hypothetical protein